MLTTTKRGNNMTTKQQDQEFYGHDAKEWVARWDKGESIWSVSMGGIGPGYEQAIQVMAVEMVRAMLDLQIDSSRWKEEGEWEADRSAIEARIKPTIESIGPSGAQFGAALNLAACMYKRGPSCLQDAEIKDKLIQVSNNWPRAKC